MNGTSALSLIQQLCDLQLGPAQRSYRVQPAVSRTEARRRLKRKAHDTLFSYLNNKPLEDHYKNEKADREIEGILLEVFKMRSKRKFEEADRLEGLFNKLRKDGNDEINQFLKFLVALKHCGDNPVGDQLGENVFHFPSVETKEKLAVVPTGPVCYGDFKTRTHDKGQHFYMHYPKELFERPLTDISRVDEKQFNNAFDLHPGKGLGPDCLFTTRFLLGDFHELTTHNSLFGGLMQGRVKDLSIHLELPELSSVPQLKIPEFKCKKSMSSSALSDESGLGSGTASMSSSLMTVQDQSSSDEGIWEQALTEIRSNHYTWEWIGYQPGPTERPHLTEAGSGVFDILIQLRQRLASIVCPQVEVTQFITVQPQILVKHVLLMLIGIPSKIFPYNQETQSFGIADGLHISGTSPEMVAEYLKEFVECGTSYSRLTQFSHPPVLNSFYTGGLIFQAFASAVRKVLSHFTAAVLKIPQTLLLLQLKVYIFKAMDQIRYLSKLCQCHDKPPPSDAPGDFPTGMKLLSYMYDETDVSASSSHYPMLLSILQTTCAPFMLFIRDWVFHGVHRDYYGEFMIRADLGCQESRDETYWDKAYTLMTENENGTGTPQFLKDTIHDIVTCGKSINLLRICNRQHFMCNVNESDIPTVTITFSQEDLKASEKYCQAYVGRMRQIARQISDDRKEVLRKAEQQKLELQQTARRIADAEIARLQGIIIERKKKADAKKRLEFDRLKKQMETDLKRRANQQEEEEEEDRQFVARLNREEEALTEQEIELEKKARDDLIEYYTELGEEAMHRERVAMWKVRRAQLGNKRLQFLEEDADRWRKELKEHQTAKDVLDSGQSQRLPGWAERQSEENAPLEVTDEEEINLPAWARQELLVSDDSAEEEPVDSETVLPKWAERVLTIEVQDEEFIDKEDENEIVNRDEEDDSENEDKDLIENGDPGGKLSEDLNQSTRQFRAVQLGGTPLPKPHVKKSVNAHSSKETEETESKPHIHKVEGKSATAQSEETVETKPNIKMVQGVNALTESEESKQKVCIKSSSTMSATKQSDPNTEGPKPHLKFIEGAQVNEQTTEERQIIPKRHRDQNSQNATSETESKVWVIKKPNMFGHVSQLSNADYVLTVPKLRRHQFQHANMESDFKDFGIKPRIRMSKTMSASTESEVPSDSTRQQTHIRVLAHRNVSIESQRIDENAVIRQRFRSRNIRGHASDSTVQKLLYGDYGKLDSVSEDDTDGPLPRIVLKPGLPYHSEEYQKEFLHLADEPSLDLMSHVFVADLGRDLVDSAATSEEEVEAYKYTPLSVLLTRSMTAPVRAQISLVNNAVINYFTTELKVDDHFKAIRRYLLMADGDFAEILSNILLEKLSTNPLPQEILNPVFLNGALNKAIRSSIHSDDENTQNLSFALKYMPSVLMPNAPNSLKCLELRYNITWPLNVVLTTSCMEKYYKVFNFMLQIKRVVWVLKDVWHRLKRDALINKATNSSQFRHLQLHRQEMEHFVKMMQGYITNQVIHVTWQEFQTSLSQPIAGLDQLMALHQSYVDRAVSRCLLDKKAEKVMKIIKDIFCLILKFRSQLVSASWIKGDKPGEVTHPNFSSMVNTYQSFHVYSFFLFKVVNRLSLKGYQPHLQELLLQLNFNDYYTEAAN